MDFFEKCTLSGSKTTNGMEFPIFSATGSVPVKAFSAGVSLWFQRKSGFGCVSVVWAAHKRWARRQSSVSTGTVRGTGTVSRVPSVPCRGPRGQDQLLPITLSRL